MDENINRERLFKPLFEFGALVKYCAENHLTKEKLIVHTKMPELSKLYYKVRGSLTGCNLELFDSKVQEAYDRFIDEMDQKLGLR